MVERCDLTNCTFAWANTKVRLLNKFVQVVWIKHRRLPVFDNCPGCSNQVFVRIGYRFSDKIVLLRRYIVSSCSIKAFGCKIHTIHIRIRLMFNTIKYNLWRRLSTFTLFTDAVFVESTQLNRLVSDSVIFFWLLCLVVGFGVEFFYWLVSQVVSEVHVAVFKR